MRFVWNDYEFKNVIGAVNYGRSDVSIEITCDARSKEQAIIRHLTRESMARLDNYPSRILMHDSECSYFVRCFASSERSFIKGNIITNNITFDIIDCITKIDKDGKAEEIRVV